MQRKLHAEHAKVLPTLAGPDPDVQECPICLLDLDDRREPLQVTSLHGTTWRVAVYITRTD